MEQSTAVETGRVIFGAWKHVRLYEAMVHGRLGATSVAGKSGDLLGRLRMLARYEIEPLVALATDVGISRQELEMMTLPALVAAQGLHVQREDGRPIAMVPIAVDQDDVMAIVAAIWEAAGPTPEERGAVELLRLASCLPVTPDEAIAGLGSIGLDEPSAQRAIELAESVNLVRRKSSRQKLTSGAQSG